MIKSLADLSLRLADLVEAEGRVAKAHAVRFLIAGLTFALAALTLGMSLLLVWSAALLGLVAAGLSWPIAILLVALGLIVTAVGLGFAGRAVLIWTRPARVRPDTGSNSSALSTRAHADAPSPTADCVTA